MRKLIVLLFSLSVISCNTAKNESDKLNSLMQSWEKLIVEDPEALLDSLTTLDKFTLSEENVAYRNLLTSIAKERCVIREHNDKKITASLKWYERHRKDGRNYCRALLYKGIVMSMTSTQDTLAYGYILKADSVYQERQLEDPYALGKCYEHKSRMLKNQKAFPQAEIYLDKAIKASSSINDSIGVVRLKTKLFRLYLAMGKLTKAFQNVSEFQMEQNASPIMQYEFSNALNIFYTSSKDPEMAATYLKKMINLVHTYDLKDIDYGNLNYRLGIFYDTHGMKDSANIFYLKSIEVSKDTVTLMSPSYFSRYALFLEKAGNYNEAYKYQKEAFDRLRTYSNRRTQERLLEIDNKNELEKITSSLAKVEKFNRMLMSLIVLLLIGLVYIIFRNRFLRSSNISVNDIEDKEWLLCEISKASAAAMPKLIEDVFDEAERCRKQSQGISDNLQRSVKSAREEIKNQFAQIVDDQRFKAAYPYTKYLHSNCSPLEILMLVLIKTGYSSKEIASMLTIQYSSVRARKSKIKDAIMENENISEEQKVSMLF